MHVDRDYDLFDALLHFNKLCGAGLRVREKSAAFGPRVCRVVMIYVAEHEATSGLVHDDPDAIVHANRPEILVVRLLKLVELQTWMRRVHLQIKGGVFCRLLFIAR